MSLATELLDRLAQLYVVTKCKCFMQRSKSTTHIDCMYLETWVVDELVKCVELTESKHVNDGVNSSADSIMYTESLDSLMPDSNRPPPPPPPQYAPSQTVRWRPPF